MTPKVGEGVWERVLEGGEYETRGGRIYEIVEAYDDEGELEALLRIVSRRGRRIDFRTVSARDIDLSLVEPLNDMLVRTLVRAMAAELAAGRGRWNSTDRAMLHAIRCLADVS